mmetsp:Transcript_15935/g.39673  ORF Transcript_15935/g.39673 Transcript_15935/m.39673 type:complete len:261 (-) Transcript_15935:1392-2174(-)
MLPMSVPVLPRSWAAPSTSTKLTDQPAGLPLVLGSHHDLLILSSCVVPGQILVHAAQRDLVERFAVLAEREHRVAHRLAQLVGLRAVKRPARACTRVLKRVVRLDRVPQPAHRVHHRHGAIRHGVQLVKAARLKAGRHEQDVDARSDTVRHLDRETDPAPALVLVARLHVTKSGLQVLAPRPQQHELALLSHDPVVVVADEVHTLLVVQAADEAHHGDVWVHWQAKLLLQCHLARALARHKRGHVVVLVPLTLQELVIGG